MRLKLLKLATILLLAGSSDGRPQKLEVSASLQPELQNDNTEGWRPVQHETKISQESIPVGKNLPQIVEGNSRYTEEGPARRGKSYVRNNPFYEDYIPVFDKQKKTSDKTHGQLDLEALRSEVTVTGSNPLEGTRHRQDDKVVIRSRNISEVRISSSYAISKNKVEGPSTKTTDLKNDEILNRTDTDRQKFNPLIDKVSTNEKSNLSLTAIKNPDNTASDLDDKISSPAILSRKKISSHYRGQTKSSPLLLNSLSNVGSLASLNLYTSFSQSRILGNESETRTIHLKKVRSPIIPHALPISNGHKPVHVNKEKVMNFVKIVPTYSDLKNSSNETTFLRSSLHNLNNHHNPVSETGSYNSKTEVESSQSNSNGIVTGFRRLTNQTLKHQFGNKNSMKNLSSLTNNSKHKPNSSQSIPDLKLKNWPNENLQNIEDLFNYEKYTSFHNTDENLEAQETAEYLTPEESSANVHMVTEKPDKKPSILIFDHSLLPTKQVQNSEADLTVINDPESHVNLEQSADEVVQWEQIHPLTSNNGDFLVADVNEAESNAFDPIPEGLQPNRPLNPGRDEAQSTNYYGHVDESSSETNLLMQVAHNYDDYPVQTQEHYQNQFDQPIVGNPNLESTSETHDSDGSYGVHQNDPVHGPDLPNQPYFNPVSVVSQNTVVHILNAGKKRPNVTVTEMKVTPHQANSSLDPKDHSADSKNSSASTPNVHIMFTTQEDEVKENEPQYGLMANQKVPEVTYDDSINCPTIKINSYTMINNTIQGKEGCTDLNIIISSHVLNTNVINPASTSAGNDGSGNKVPSQRYPGNGQVQPSYAISDGSYATSGGSYGTFSTGSGQDTGGLVPGVFQDYPPIESQNNPGILQDGQFGQQSPSTSIFEVFQQTEINVGSQNDVSSTGDALDPSITDDCSSTGDALSDTSGSPDAGEPNAPSSTGPGVGGDPSNPGALSDTDVSMDPASPPQLADDPGPAEVASDPVTGGGTPSFPPLSGIQGPLADDGPADVAADTPLSPGTGGIQFPSISNPLSGISNPLSGISNPLSGISNPLSGVSNPLQSGNPLSQLGGSQGDDGDGDDDDDEADDDMLDLIPFSIMESMMSMLPYVTLLNPLNYGILSFAISPFAVAVVGLFGLAAAVVPFALRGAFNFGRASDRVTIRLGPSLEEVVKRSIDQYENWNEWKSKRKKRRR